jgi:hypothetical protein
MCQRNHGAAFVTWIGVPRAQLSLVAGEDVLAAYPSSAHGVRKFCSRCGSSLFCELDHAPDVVDVTLASVRGPIDRPPAAHVFFDDRAPWVTAHDDLPKLDDA